MRFRVDVMLQYALGSVVTFMVVTPLAMDTFPRNSPAPLVLGIASSGFVLLLGLSRALGALLHFSLASIFMWVLLLQIPALMIASSFLELRAFGVGFLMVWVIGLFIHLLHIAGRRMATEKPPAPQPDFARGTLTLEWTEGETTGDVETPRVRTTSRNRTAASRSVWVRNEIRPVLQIQLFRQTEECCAFEQAEVWGDVVAVGYGERLLLVHLVTHAVREFPLGSYFGSFRMTKSGLLVASAQRLILIDNQHALEWSTVGLGIDGVVIKSVEKGVVYGEGEWDPPGGWKPFQVSLRTGKLLADL